jgi:hypothetical protein
VGEHRGTAGHWCSGRLAVVRLDSGGAPVWEGAVGAGRFGRPCGTARKAWDRGQSARGRGDAWEQTHDSAPAMACTDGSVRRGGAMRVAARGRGSF